MMNASEFASFIRNRYGEDSMQAAQLGTANTNWQKEVLRTTFSHDYSLSVGGTAGVLPYRVAVNYTGTDGVVRETDNQRLGASVNLTPKFFDDLLSVNAPTCQKARTSPTNTAATAPLVGRRLQPDPARAHPERAYSTTTPPISTAAAIAADATTQAPTSTTSTQQEPRISDRQPHQQVEGIPERGQPPARPQDALPPRTPRQPQPRLRLQPRRKCNGDKPFAPGAWDGNFTVLPEDGGAPLLTRTATANRNKSNRTLYLDHA